VADAQTSPAGVQPVVPAGKVTAHVPRLAPVAFTHDPPQQSPSAVQASPSWTQKEGLASQTPFVQSFEQHSVPIVHGLPLVLQLALSGVQVFAPPSAAAHAPPQHCESVVHA
jgi:hypothetical protein